MVWQLSARSKFFRARLKYKQNRSRDLTKYTHLKNKMDVRRAVKYSDEPCLTVLFMVVVQVKDIHLASSNYLGGKQSFI